MSRRRKKSQQLSDSYHSNVSRRQRLLVVPETTRFNTFDYPLLKTVELKYKQRQLTLNKPVTKKTSLTSRINVGLLDQVKRENKLRCEKGKDARRQKYFASKKTGKLKPTRKKRQHRRCK